MPTFLATPLLMCSLVAAPTPPASSPIPAADPTPTPTTDPAPSTTDLPEAGSNAEKTVVETDAIETVDSESEKIEATVVASPTLEAEPASPAETDAVTMADDATALAEVADLAPLTLPEQSIAALRGLDRFEVRTTSAVRDAEGRVAEPQVHGRIVFERVDDDDVRIVLESWGGVETARLVADRDGMTIGLPARRIHARFDRLPDAWGDRPELSTWLSNMLARPGMEARFGAATVHLLDLLQGDSTLWASATTDERLVDLGPCRARMTTILRTESGVDGPTRLHVACRADGPPLPLAVATPMEDGGTIEFEYHDWSIGRFHEDDPTRFEATTPADWTPVVVLPRPERFDPEMPWCPAETLVGRFAVSTDVAQGVEEEWDVFDATGALAILFDRPGDSGASIMLEQAVADLDVEVREVCVTDEPDGSMPSISPRMLEKIWGIDELPALVMVDPTRRVIAARAPWFGPTRAPAPSGLATVDDLD